MNGAFFLLSSLKRHWQLTSLALVLSMVFTLSATAQRLNLEDAVMGQYGSLLPQKLRFLQWANGATNGWAFVDEQETLNVFNVKGRRQFSLTLETLNTSAGLSMERFPEHEWTRSGRFRFTYKQRVYEHDLNRGSTKLRFELDQTAHHAFSPDGLRIAATQENNVVIIDAEGATDITDLESGVTAGQAIARHEFGISEGLFWSPNSERLGFYQKDERHVSAYPLTDYTQIPAESSTFKYPVAGGHSEYASFGIYDVRNASTVYLNVNNGVLDDSYYITNVAWAPDSERLFAVLVTRNQKNLQLIEFDAESGLQLRLLLSENDQKYIEPEHPLVFIPDGSGDFLWFSQRNGFNNLYRYSAEGLLKGGSTAQFPITELLGFTEKGKTAIVAAHGPDPKERHIYRLDLSSFQLTALTQAPGTHRAQLSADGNHMLDEWSSTTVARKTELVRVGNGSRTVLLESTDPLARYTHGKTNLGTLEAEDGTPLHYRMILPPQFDKTRRYPVLIYVYNGPHVQLVTNSWLAGAPIWMHSLASDGFIVFTLDGRGSANRGKDFEQAIHRNLGQIEMADQMAGVDWLKRQPYVDDSRLAVHGWSYGGFMTTSLMLEHPGVFRVAVAGGSVIDWQLYEVMYTERYMESPEENPDGYARAALTSKVDRLQGKILLIHGSDDDVVLLQHSMRFLSSCIDQGRLVDFFVYPGHRHNVHGKDRVHLMKKVFDYLFNHI